MLSSRSPLFCSNFKELPDEKDATVFCVDTRYLCTGSFTCSFNEEVTSCARY